MRTLETPDWHDAYANRKTADTRFKAVKHTLPAKLVREKINAMSLDEFVNKCNYIVSNKILVVGIRAVGQTRLMLIVCSPPDDEQ